MSVAGKVGVIRVVDMLRSSPDSVAVEYEAGTADGSYTTAGVWFMVTLRKAHPCAVCDSNMRPGDEAFRPLTEAPHRHNRLCLSCVNSRAPWHTGV